jgi:hypothetical protein
MARICILVALIGLVSTQEFLMFDGKTADPCNRYLVPYLRPDCEKENLVADPTVTVVIPSVMSSPKQFNPPTQTLLYNRPLTITGTGFTPLVGANHGFLALATVADTCREIDLNFPVIPVQVFINRPRHMVFRIPQGWDTVALELEDRPRVICWSPEPVAPALNSFRYTGFKLGVVRNCEGDATSAPLTSVSLCTTEQQRLYGAANWQTLAPLQLEARIFRTKCCKSTIPNSLGTGQCINPNLQACCGGAAYTINRQKCCNSLKEIVTDLDQPCPCQSSADCGFSQQCCSATKYPDLIDPYVSFGQDPWYGVRMYPVTWFRGQCFNPLQTRCCDTGSIYDPGSHQCCRINGIQSLNEPCPCNADFDCIGTQTPTFTRNYNQTCCKQTTPTLLENENHQTFADNAALKTDTLACSIYNNYPNGQGPSVLQRCLGRCIDPNFQVCCNGAACMKEYERCCNATCCNKWTATCFYGFKGGAIGMRHNHWNYGTSGTFDGPEMYELCSSVEHITTIKGFWIFVLPATLLLASHLGLALVMVFASKATPRYFSKLELLMMLVAIIVSYLAMPLFFSPNWKYPVFIIFAQLFVFLTASARIRWLNVACVVIQLGILLYVFDPFHGNAFLTTSSNRFPDGTDDVMTSGLLHSITKSWHSVDQARMQRWCTTFYDYFAFDPILRDFERRDNPQVFTFGYCSRAFGNALLLLSGGVMAGVLIQLILSLLGIFFRFHHERSVVALEVLEEHPY